MEFVGYALFAALVFGLCFLVDKGFSRLFRNRKQHKSGKSVRFSKRVCAIGVVLGILGFSAILFATSPKTIYIICGSVLVALGSLIVVRYTTFGIYYDENSFLVTRFGRKSEEHSYSEIRAQQLFTTPGSVVVELYLHNKHSIQIQSNMDGAYPFLDHAFRCWLEQTGKTEAECSFYDPSNSHWFPDLKE